MIGCAICPATEPNTLAALAHGWTSRILAHPVTYRSVFGGPLPATPAGEQSLCPGCAAWLVNHRDRMLPPAALEVIEAAITAWEQAEGRTFNPATARLLRLELIGMVRHLAEALTPAAAG